MGNRALVNLEREQIVTIISVLNELSSDRELSSREQYILSVFEDTLLKMDTGW